MSSFCLIQIYCFNSCLIIPSRQELGFSSLINTQKQLNLFFRTIKNKGKSDKDIKYAKQEIRSSFPFRAYSRVYFLSRLKEKLFSFEMCLNHMLKIIIHRYGILKPCISLGIGILLIKFKR